MDFRKLLFDTLNYLTIQHPEVLLDIVINQSGSIFTSDYKTVMKNIIVFICDKHPDIIIGYIKKFGPQWIDAITGTTGK